MIPTRPVLRCAQDGSPPFTGRNFPGTQNCPSLERSAGIVTCSHRVRLGSHMSLSTVSKPASLGLAGSVSKNFLILLWTVALAAGTYYVLHEVPQYFVFTQDSY